MNKVILMGRLTRDPEVRYGQGENATAVARWSLAVDRRVRNGEQQEADFINCVAFGKQAEHAERYFRKGKKIALVGRIQTGSYTKDGVKVYTTDVVVEETEFVESKAAEGQNGQGYQSQQPSNTNGYSKPQTQQQTPPPYPNYTGGYGDGFMNIPEGIDEELPFA